MSGNFENRRPKDRSTMPLRLALTSKLKATFAVALGVAAIFAANTAPADAGTYSITQSPCLNNGWTYGGNNVWAYAVSDNCSGNVTVDGTKSPGGTGFAFWRSPKLPDTAWLSGGSVYGMLRYTTSNHGALLRSCWRNQWSYWYGGCAGDGLSYPDVPSNSWGSIVPEFGTNIAGIQIDLERSEVGGAAALTGINLTATENTPPSISREAYGNPTFGFPSGGWDSSAWLRGTKTLYTTADDSKGLGVKSQTILIDGGSLNGGVTINRPAAQFGCSFGTWAPCPAIAQWSTDWDTAALAGGVPDGPHTISMQGVDAANNTGSWGPYSFKVDNTKPDAPTSKNGAGDGLSGYGATNSFDITWANGAETTETVTQSGISHVVLDLQPVSPTSIDPAPVVIPVGGSAAGVSATLDSLSGVTLPEQASYRFGIGVRDKAGNWSSNVDVDANNNPTGVDIDPDDAGTIIWNEQPPPPPVLQNNGWVSEAELLAGYSQKWNVSIPMGGPKICGYSADVTDNQSDDPGSTINVVGDVRDWELPSDLSEGSHYVHIKSIGCNLLPATTTATTDVKVDLTDPVSSYSGVTAGKWYKDGTVVTISATDALSGMTGVASPAPYATGAYLDYSINSVSPAEPARGGEAQLPISGEGQKQLRFAAVDVAGNRSEDTIVNFGIDATNPTGYLEPTDPATPTLLRAPLADIVSGIETASIEVHQVSGGEWISLPTALADLRGQAVAGNPTSALASARFPDTTLAEDDYRVRVTAVDQAGNTIVTDRDKNGRPLIVASGSLRSYSGLSASLFKSKRTCSRRHGVKCVKSARGKVVFTGGKQRLSVGFKRGAAVAGFLVDANLKPIARQPIEVYTTARGHAEVLAGTSSTRADGSYVFKLKPGVSREVRVYYPGTETRRDTSTRVELGTGAKLTLHVSRSHAKSGQTVTFSGNVTSFDGVVPASGKIVALQFLAARRWRPAVAIARTDGRGRFSVKYRFDGRAVKARIVFRVMAPAEDGWSHATSTSKRITLRLN